MRYRILACLLSFLPLAQAASPPPLSPGLITTLSSKDLTLTRLTLSPNFTLAPAESIHPQLQPDFTLTYAGQLRILREGTYTLRAAEGATLTLDDKPAINVSLTSGDHTLRITYTRAPSQAARFQLTWSSDLFPEEPIPSSALGHVGDLAPDLLLSTQVDRGRLLALNLNCTACHAGTLPHAQAPTFDSIASRLNSAWIKSWLESPKHFRAIARMPAIPLSDGDRNDVATYLATLADANPDPRKLDPTDDLRKTGQALYESIGCANCHTLTDLGPLASKYLTAASLSKYLQDPLAFHPDGHMPSMLLDQPQADALAAYLYTAVKTPQPTFTPTDSTAGQSLVYNTGCINCHQPLADAATTYPNFSHLKPAAGCLAEHPAAPAVNYDLPPDDRLALTAFVASIQAHPDVAEAPAYDYQQQIQLYNCIACHTSDGFAPKVKIDGIPPLSLAGQKLRPDWIHAVLQDKQRVRPWLKLRMPHFGPPVAPLEPDLVAISGTSPLEPLAAPDPAKAALGRRLVGKGAGGYSCITCHAYLGNDPPAPEQSRGPELTLMDRRLRPDFFHRWVRDPQRILPGTVMPSFFTGKPLAEADPVIDTLWSYCSLGPSMPIPEGAAQSGHETFILAGATTRPIVQRCFLDGGGVAGKFSPIPRALAVSLPGELSYAFDPEACQLRYAWTGPFIDITQGWTNRGDSHAKRLGTPVYNFLNDLAIVIDNHEAPANLQYKGYAFNKDSLDILFTARSIEFRQRIAPTATGFTLTYTFDPAGHSIDLVPPQGSHVQTYTGRGVQSHTFTITLKAGK